VFGTATATCKPAAKRTLVRWVLLAFRIVAPGIGPIEERRPLMRPSEFETIRPHLKRAVDDIDYFLTVLEEQEIDKRVWSKLYDLIEDGWTPTKVKARLTKTQYMALVYRTKLRRRKRPDEPLDERQGKPLTDEEREAILADLDQGEPLSDAGREAFAFWARGGWLESSRQMAVRLRNAGETVAADEINEALRPLRPLRPLCDEPRDAAERSDYREAMRTAAEYVKTILVQYPIQRQPSELMTVTPGAENGGSETPAELRSVCTARQLRLIDLLWKVKTATHGDAIEAVWGKDSTHTSDNVHTLVGELKKKISKTQWTIDSSVPKRLTLKRWDKTSNGT